MKDLFVLTADSDAEAALRSILVRHKDLGIRPIEVDVKRFPGRDSGMVREGPEIARAMVKKADYLHLILIWDHDGSGWHARDPKQAVAAIQQRLDGITWAKRSAAIVAVPEIEEWIWHCQSSMAKHLGVTVAVLNEMTDQFAAKQKLSPGEHYRKYPKELFESVLYLKERRRPLPSDFAALGTRASLKAWRGSETFARLADTLAAWFPLGTT